MEGFNTTSNFNDKIGNRGIENSTKYSKVRQQNCRIPARLISHSVLNDGILIADITIGNIFIQKLNRN